MNDETLIALKQSIEHWRRMEQGKTGKDDYPGQDTCALCGLFNSKKNDFKCKGCPVMMKTRIAKCSSTPYHDASVAYGEASLDFLPLARKEREFLESLLP